MPLKGLLLIFVIAFVCAVVFREDIYKWLTSEFSDSDDNYISDDDNLEEEQKR